MQGDDEVPQPGGGEVGADQYGAEGHRQHAVQEEVHLVVECHNFEARDPPDDRRQ